MNHVIDNALYDIKECFGDKLHTIHNNSPKHIKKHSYNFLHVLKYFIKKIKSMSIKKCNKFYLVKGKEKIINMEMKVLFVDYDLLSVNYFLKIIFSDAHKINKIEKKVSCSFKKIIRNPNSYDMVFIKKDKVYSKLLEKYGFFVIPKMISMSIDLSDQQKQLYSSFSRTIRKNINKVVKNKFSYEVSEDISKLDFFYYKMYLPFVKNRYADEAIIMDYSFVKNTFENGKLILVKDNGKYKLGVLICCYGKNKALLSLTGVAGNNQEYLDKNAGLASTYFSILWSKDNDIETLNFGFCKPYLNDGVFQHNKKWGTYVEKFRNHTYNIDHDQIFGLKILNLNKGVKNFLERNPFICLNNGQLNGMVFSNNHLGHYEVDNIYKKYAISGLNKLYLCFMKNISDDTRNLINTRYKNKIILVDKKTLKKKYCQFV